MSKKYAVMLFDTEFNLGVSIHPNNGAEALHYYTHSPSQFSEIIDAEDMYELQCKMGEMMLNYRDEEWLNKNVYPRI